MRKLPTTSNRRSWSYRRKAQAWWAIHLAKRRRARLAGSSTLREGLVAYWKLDEAEGAVRLDSSGNGLHLTDNNLVGAAEGLIGGAADFSYADYDRWLDHPDHALLRFDGDFTVSCWVRRHGSVWGSDTIINATDSIYFFTNEGEGHRVILSVYDGPGSEFVLLVGDAVITEDAWHHLVFYRHGNTFGIVTDAGTPATAVASQAVHVGEMFRIGANEAGYPFTGLIDEVGKWNRALSADEIAQLYNAGAGLPLEEF